MEWNQRKASRSDQITPAALKAFPPEKMVCRQLPAMMVIIILQYLLCPLPSFSFSLSLLIFSSTKCIVPSNFFTEFHLEHFLNQTNKCCKNLFFICFFIRWQSNNPFHTKRIVKMMRKKKKKRKMEKKVIGVVKMLV